MVKYFLVLLTALVLSGCISFENRLKDTERIYGVETAFWQAAAKYDSEPSNVEYRSFLEYYGNRAISQLIARADYQLANNEYDQLYSTLYYGRNSAASIIDAFRARGFNHLLSNKPQEMRQNVDKSFSDYYLRALTYFDNADYHQAIQAFSKMRSLSESEKYIRLSQNEIKYMTAMNTFERGNYRSAYRLFVELPEDLRDVRTKRDLCLLKGRIIIAVEPFEGFGTDFIYRKVMDEIRNDKFISIIELENVQKYGSMNPSYFRNNNIDFILSARADYSFKGPFTRDFNGATPIWRVSDEKKIIRVSKKDGKTCTEFIFKSQPANYYIQESVLNADVIFSYKIVRISDFATQKSETFSACYEDRFEYNVADRMTRVENFTLRNPQFDTLYSCEPVTHFNFNFSHADRRFQEQFNTNKQHPTDRAIIERLSSDISGNAWHGLSKSIISLEKPITR